MWPFSKIRHDFGPRLSLGRVIRARFDAATTTPDNARHWANADGLSADASASADVRRTLRNRARYEVANNSYARGIVLTLANDCVGTGPRLQMLGNQSEFNRQIEQAFVLWAREIDLAAKLRAMRMAKATDGEAFGMLALNPALESPVKLDLRLIEADRITDPSFHTPQPRTVDGIEFDPYGNPIRYAVLREHPREMGIYTSVGAFDRVPGDAILHWFRIDRPGQHRGIPEITPALPLFAQLRRYTLAVIGAAETAADFAAVLYTNAPASGEAASVEPMDVVRLEKRMATVLPDGWQLGQIKAEQPGTTYGEFKREILNEIARCLNMPFNVAAGNSSGYNYASGRLDHQTYFKSIRVEQSDCDRTVLDPLFAAWIKELRLIEGFAWPEYDESLPHQWFWDGTEHVDPAKEANAQGTRLTNHTTTLAAEYARQGKDWENELRQRAKEHALIQELGLEIEPATATTAPEGPEDDANA